MMPLAPSYEFRTAVRDGGVRIELWHHETGKKKEFFLAGFTATENIDSHMLSLTESQCEQFLAEKKAIVKEKKEKKPVEVKQEEAPVSLKDSFKSYVDGQWVKTFKD